MKEVKEDRDFIQENKVEFLTGDLLKAGHGSKKIKLILEEWSGCSRG